MTVTELETELYDVSDGEDGDTAMQLKEARDGIASTSNAIIKTKGQTFSAKVKYERQRELEVGAQAALTSEVAKTQEIATPLKHAVDELASERDCRRVFTGHLVDLREMRIQSQLKLDATGRALALLPQDIRAIATATVREIGRPFEAHDREAASVMACLSAAVLRRLALPTLLPVYCLLIFVSLWEQQV